MQCGTRKVSLVVTFRSGEKPSVIVNCGTLRDHGPLYQKPNAYGDEGYHKMKSEKPVKARHDWPTHSHATEHTINDCLTLWNSLRLVL